MEQLPLYGRGREYQGDPTLKSVVLAAHSIREVLCAGCERVKMELHENGFGNWIVIF